tara:strand:+ start:10888 stop:11316 length:429 start_codon:yes stop_codon:yes gene_type:complete
MAATHFSGPLAVGAGGVEVLTAAKTLTTAADNGKIFFLNAAAGATITLPKITQNGVKLKFITTLAFATTNWIIASAEGDNISGTLLVVGATVTAIAEDQINFVASAELVGDWIELISDATNSQWIVSGVADNTGAITATDPA